MSELKITGTITKVLNPENRTSKAGKEWSKQDFVITTGGKYPDDIAFTLFGDKMDLISNVKIGDEVEVSFNLSSREYNERYFHNVNAWRVALIETKTDIVDTTNDVAAEHNKQFENSTDVSESGDTGLPF